MANSADPDQLASSLFAKAGYIRVQQDKGKQCYFQTLFLYQITPFWWVALFSDNSCFLYGLYPKYFDTLTSYHTYSKIWTIYYRMLCLKVAG